MRKGYISEEGRATRRSARAQEAKALAEAGLPPGLQQLDLSSNRLGADEDPPPRSWPARSG